jgi:hypothetical protein
MSKASQKLLDDLSPEKRRAVLDSLNKWIEINLSDDLDNIDEDSLQPAEVASHLPQDMDVSSQEPVIFPLNPCEKKSFLRKALQLKRTKSIQDV